MGHDMVMGRRIVAGGYKYIAKPLLFRFPPDKVHNAMVATVVRCQKSAALRTIIRRMFSYEDEILQRKVAGIEFANPIGLSAGFDKNIELPPMMQAIGFGFMTGGSVTAKPCAGNVRPWFHRLPKERSIVVHAGLGNEGSKIIAERIKGRSDSLPLFVSAAPTNDKSLKTADAAIADYLQTIRRLHTHAQAIELNISCPNTFDGEPFTSPRLLTRLLTEVDKLSLSQLVFIKMPHDLEWPEYQELLGAIVGHNVTGVTVSNLRKDRTCIAVPEGVRGGLSGKPTWEKSNELIEKTYERYGDKLVIIGVGGVFGAEDAYTKIRLGASLVGLITGMIYEGPQLIGDINAGLARLLRADGYTNIAEAVGADVKKRTIE